MDIKPEKNQDHKIESPKSEPKADPKPEPTKTESPKPRVVIPDKEPVDDPPKPNYPPPKKSEEMKQYKKTIRRSRSLTNIMKHMAPPVTTQKAPAKAQIPMVPRPISYRFKIAASIPVNASAEKVFTVSKEKDDNG